jgi:hypothetical protein
MDDALRRNLGLTNVTPPLPPNCTADRRVASSNKSTARNVNPKPLLRAHGGNGKENIQTMLDGKESRPRWSKQSASMRL